MGTLQHRDSPQDVGGLSRPKVTAVGAKAEVLWWCGDSTWMPAGAAFFPQAQSPTHRLGVASTQCAQGPAVTHQ